MLFSINFDAVSIVSRSQNVSGQQFHCSHNYAQLMNQSAFLQLKYETRCDNRKSHDCYVSLCVATAMKS